MKREKAVAEGDVLASNRYIKRRANVPTPEVPDSSYVFNRSTEPVS